MPSGNIMNTEQRLEANRIRIAEEVKTISKKKVLLVDDDPMVLLAVKSMILRLGCEVESAENGEVAVNKIKENNKAESTKYDLVFMDINMPIMNGYTATRQIKDLIALGEIIDVPIICLSAQDSDGHKKMAEELRFAEQSKSNNNINS